MRVTNLFKLHLMLLIFMILSSCATTKPKEVEVNRINVTYDYAPKVLNKVGSAETTIALINPQFAGNDYSGTSFDLFRKSMANDFEELLTAKGFKIRGPFEQQGEMLYNDKENSDFILEIEIDLNANGLERFRQNKSLNPSFGELLINSNAPSVPYYMYYGKGTISSSLNIIAKSTRFNEKLWKKYINLTPVPFEYTGTVKWQDKGVSLLDEIGQDNTVYNAFFSVLMTQYKEIFELLEKQIEVQELNNVKIEARKVDKK